MKVLLSILALGAGALFLFGRSKATDLQQIMDNIKVRITRISDIDISKGKLLFTADVSLVNPTMASFGFNTFKNASLRQLRFFDDNGNFLGTADTNFFELDIPPNSSTALPSVRVRANIGQVATSLLFGQLDDLQVAADLEVLGRTYTIDQQR
ncbi:hypothetical protein ACFQ1M_09730 [Sungkyunkwania multivorans]|uniref:Late embryogenesis abundant protein LEA-2 subgroup domain-containing protein n=1 Tax=Sungkyunkwania multivorans TaxID=1173618 RepID=A0ABW3D0J9_9FLAO